MNTPTPTSLPQESQAPDYYGWGLSCAQKGLTQAQASQVIEADTRASEDDQMMFWYGYDLGVFGP